jgi:hypothetical protein
MKPARGRQLYGVSNVVKFNFIALLLMVTPFGTLEAKQKQRNNPVCSILQVYVVPADLSHGHFDWPGIKYGLEENTWLKVPDVVVLMPKDPSPDTGTVQLIELYTTGYRSESHSYGTGAYGESGNHVVYELKLMDARGNVLWTGMDGEELEGIKSKANKNGSEAHEVHADPVDAVERIARRLNSEANCGFRPKRKKAIAE